MAEPLLNIAGLSASYEETIAVRDVDLQIAPAQIVCIVGESGSGKSSLIKAIHGMSNIVIESGTITLNGRDITKLKGKARRQLMGTCIGLIPQNPAASFNPIRRLDTQLREALAGHDMPYDEDHICELLQRIGLSKGREVLRRRPYELSGGMNQRVAIAAAMMFQPKLLMCDEATSALDVTTAGTVAEELLKIRDAGGTSILIVTHHLGLAKRMADMIGIMQNGRIIEYGTMDHIFEAPENEYTQRLIRDVPRLRTEDAAEWEV